MMAGLLLLLPMRAILISSSGLVVWVSKKASSRLEGIVTSRDEAK